MNAARRAFGVTASYLRRYGFVAAFSGLLAIGALVFFVRQEARDGILSNAPLELLGIAVSALVTVFVVERAMSSAEEQRRRPLSQQILWRIRGHTMHNISSLVWKCNPNIPRANQRHDYDARRERLGHAVEQQDCFSHLEVKERQKLYEQIRASADVLRDELSRHQVVFSWYPDLYRAIIAVDYRTLEWSVYRDEDLEPEATGEEENANVCQVARAFLALAAELDKLPSDE